MYNWIHQIIQELVKSGLKEVCVCPGKRNGPLLLALDAYPEIRKFPWYEERSAAFFALGRVRATGRPVAVVTTSGTAVGECLPAAMEAYYTGDPLILLTADRPKRFRGTGAPQSAEQQGIFGPYAIYEQDLEEGEPCALNHWSMRGPTHLNICLEEMQGSIVPPMPAIDCTTNSAPKPLPEGDLSSIEQFFQQVQYPLVVVGTLPPKDRPHISKILQKLQAPVYLESTSGLREDPSLEPLLIRDVTKLWAASKECGYPIDGIFRIGGVPTFRPWRDIEDMEGKINVLSVSEVPFSGLSWSRHIQMPLQGLDLEPTKSYPFHDWREWDQNLTRHLISLYEEYPSSEPGLIHTLSKTMSQDARVYLGNSLPIREWDLAAHVEAPSDVWASRGLNGIDGQLSTFLGLCDPTKDNWGIFGDFTALYDLAAPWILSEMEQTCVRLVVINNGGGQIFSRLGLGDRFTNPHNLDFEGVAKLWNLGYSRSLELKGNHQLIELVPDPMATENFWSEAAQLRSQVTTL